jgi:hypothetical protein
MSCRMAGRFVKVNSKTFEIADKGAYFTVYVYDTYVIKYPKHEKVNSKKVLNKIADIQTAMSEFMPEILPCKRQGMSLIMPRAPGVRCDYLPAEKWEEIKERLPEIEARARQHGYIILGTDIHNIFYDEGSDQIYLVDCHLYRRAGD